MSAEDKIRQLAKGYAERLKKAIDDRVDEMRSDDVSHYLICLVGMEALEIKWKDATTDGDHITKEHTRIRVIADLGYIPIRVMFYYPNRTQAIRIQETLKTLYEGIGGKYYCGDAAWDYVEDKIGIDLKRILEKLADEQERGNQCAKP